MTTSVRNSTTVPQTIERKNPFKPFSFHGRKPSPIQAALICVAFVCGSIYFLESAKRCAAGAARQQETTAVYDIQGTKSRNFWYQFLVDGKTYSGKGAPVEYLTPESLGDPIQALVYYDPQNPSLNSPMDLHLRSADEYNTSSALLKFSFFAGCMTLVEWWRAKIWKRYGVTEKG